MLFYIFSSWERKKSKDGLEYYVDHKAKITTWIHPNVGSVDSMQPRRFSSVQMSESEAAMFAFPQTTTSNTKQSSEYADPSDSGLVSLTL